MSKRKNRKPLDTSPEAVARRKRKFKRRDIATSLAAGALVVAGVVALVAAVWAVGAAVFYIAWNLGVVNIAGALGSTVGTINFWTALGGSFAVGILSRVFRRTPAVQTKD